GRRCARPPSRRRHSGLTLGRPAGSVAAVVGRTADPNWTLFDQRSRRNAPGELTRGRDNARVSRENVELVRSVTDVPAGSDLVPIFRDRALFDQVVAATVGPVFAPDFECATVMPGVNWATARKHRGLEGLRDVWLE